MRNRLLTNLRAATVRQVVSKLVVLFWIGYLSRKLGVDRFGDYAILVSLQYMLLSAIDAGSNTAFVRRVAANPADLPRSLRVYLSTRLALGVAGAFLLTQIAPLGTLDRPEIRDGARILALGLLIRSVTAAGDAVFSALEDLRVMSLVNILSTVVCVSIGLPLMESGLGLDGALWAQVGASMALGAGYLPFVIRRRIRPGRTVTWPYVKDFLWEAFRLGGPTSLAFAIGRIDRPLLAHYIGPWAASLHHAAATLIKPLPDLYWSIVPPAVFPAMTRGHAADPQAFAVAVRSILTLLQSLALPGALFIMLYAGKLLALFFGPPFAAGHAALALLAIELPLLLTCNILTNVLVIQERSSALLVLGMSSMGLTLLGNLYLIPVLGMPGAAATVVVSSLWSLAWTAWLARGDLRDYVPWGAYPSTLAACAVMLGAGILAENVGLPPVAQMFVTAAAGLGPQLWRLAASGELARLLGALDAAPATAARCP